MTTEAARARAEELLMRAVDGLLTEDEERELETLLEELPGYRDELKDFQEISAMTDAMTRRILMDARIEPIRPPTSTRALVSTSLLLLLAGFLLSTGFAAWSFLADSDVPLVLKVAAGAGGLGLLGLLVHVLRVRRRAQGRDPYQEVDL